MELITIPAIAPPLRPSDVWRTPVAVLLPLGVGLLVVLEELVVFVFNVLNIPCTPVDPQDAGYRELCL